jgi:hypothetical protein
MLRISSESGGKLACRRDWLLHPHGCEARSPEQPADDHPQNPPALSEGGTSDCENSRYVQRWRVGFSGGCNASHVVSVRSVIH